MYVPSHFAASDPELATLLASPGLVDLVSAGADGLICTPLPMLYVPSPSGLGVLQGHVARNNPHWSAVGAGLDSVAIVRGPDAYISPAWYATKAEHGRVVPTWNYLTAQVYGRLVVHESGDWLRDLVTRLTEVHEARVGSSWQVSDAPQAYIDGQLRAIVGVELQISRIEAKAKLSQNRSDADQAGVITGLGAGSAIGQAMKPELG
jgi:transcriptional regulator